MSGKDKHRGRMASGTGMRLYNYSREKVVVRETDRRDFVVLCLSHPTQTKKPVANPVMLERAMTARQRLAARQ